QSALPRRSTSNDGATTPRAGRSPWQWILLLTLPIRWPIVRILQAKWGLVYLAILLGSVLVLPSESARLSTQDQRYDAMPSSMEKLPKHDVALVLGAKVYSDNTPSNYLMRRIDTAIELQKAGKVDKLLLSGDNRAERNHETDVMQAYAVKQGVDPARIIVDPEGYSTMDSCRRAFEDYKVLSMVVVTQGYHLPRATMTCSQVGMDASGVAAKHSGQDWEVTDIAREHVATAKAYVELFMQSDRKVVAMTEAQPQ
ncbi:MAG TPA: ElyC/SanA/YdcF family protein, partial [Candidatus Limnocylindrales bacterium]|nr:ElyC/SanA/YdcF family protein [Candidatus Limnocylindrales bacterium]